MNKIKETLKKVAARPILAVTLSIAMIGGAVGFELMRPVRADAAVPAAPTSNASPLDNNSVGALLALDRAMENLAAHVTPAVVNVTVTSKVKSEHNLSGQGLPDDMQQFFGQFFGQQMPFSQPRTRIEHGLGSGVIISPDGYIVTNNHVVKGATDIRVTMSDRKVYPAKLIGTDPLTDLAVIKINGTNFPNIPWGNSTNLHVGQTVLAFGNPFGFRFTVTRGIVSALNRSNPYSNDPRKPGGFIQTDAAINPGNSGGPLVDARGEIMGINTFLISPNGAFSGMGFAIPSQIAEPIVDKLVKYGKVDHARMGVTISDVTPDNAKFFDLKNASGAVITEVQSDSPAASAGLKTGDVITAVNGKPVESASELQMEIGLMSPGDKVNLQVMRNGQPQNFTLTLASLNGSGSSEEASSTAHGKARWGIGIADITPDVRSELQLPDNVKGAVVESVQPGSPADNAGLTRGDVILQVNRKPTDSAEAVKQALDSVPPGQDVMLLVRSNGGNTFRVLHPAEKGKE
jgi:serine protease Do